MQWKLAVVLAVLLQLRGEIKPEIHKTDEISGWSWIKIYEYEIAANTLVQSFI